MTSPKSQGMPPWTFSKSCFSSPGVMGEARRLGSVWKNKSRKHVAFLMLSCCGFYFYMIIFGIWCFKLCKVHPASCNSMFKPQVVCVCVMIASVPEPQPDNAHHNTPLHWPFGRNSWEQHRLLTTDHLRTLSQLNPTYTFYVYKHLYIYIYVCVCMTCIYNISICIYKV